jgi:hypothetical protein
MQRLALENAGMTRRGTNVVPLTPRHVLLLTFGVLSPSTCSTNLSQVMGSY